MDADVGSPVAAPAPRSLRRSAAVLAATLVAAAVGPLLVAHDRWFELRRSSRYLTAFGDRFPFLAHLNLPDYAAPIAAAFLALVALGRYRAAEAPQGWRRRRAFARRPRRPTAAGLARSAGTASAAVGGGGAALLLLRLVATKRQPGAELLVALLLFGAGMLLREVSVATLRRVWRRDRAAILSIAAAHAAVILAFASHYSYRRFEAPLFGVALLAIGNLAARVRKTGPIPLIVLAFVCLYTWRIDAWWYALVGDEYRNYEIAAQIVKSHDRAFIGRHLFQLEGGLEGLDPYADSLAQAASMRLLGVNNFGWRFSSIYPAALALPFFFRFFRTFLSGRAALATTIVLGASHYIMSFGKIGYDKFQAYLAMALLLAAAACAVRTRRAIAFVLTGFAAALCFYVYPAALYVVPFAFFLFLLFAPPADRPTVSRWAIAALTAILTIFPLPFQPTYFEGKRPGTVFDNPELTRSTGVLLGHMRDNLIYAAYSPILLGGEDHYVTSSYLDPLTGLLFSVGVASALWLVRRDAFVAFLVVALGWMLFFCGATHDRDFPPTTRMFLLLPLFVPLATFGLARLLGLAREVGLAPRSESAIAWTSVAAILALNLVQTHVVSRRRSANYELFDPLVVRLARRIEELPGSALRLLFLTDAPGESGGIPMLLEVYSLRPTDFAEVAAPEGALTPEDRARVADARSAVFVSTRMPPERRDALEREIAAAGKKPCSVRTTTGEERFRLWTAPGVPDLCAN